MSVRWALYELDVPGRRLHGDEGEIHLEPQAFDVLAYLVEHRDRVIEKSELLDQVWGDQFVSESALTTRIKQVRKSLGDDGRTQRFIRNVHGRGYQFVGDIEDDSAAETVPASSEFTPRAPVALALSISLDDEFPFVGREGEVALITELLDGPNATQVLIGGAPGMGKSRLAIHVLETIASDETVVCAGRCEENVTSALQPIRDAVAQIASAHPTDFPRWAAGVEGPLASLIPSLGLPYDPEAAAVDGYAGLDVLLTVFDRVASERRIAILIDDLQWSDQPTRAFLSQVQRRAGRHPISTIASFRSGAVDLRRAAREWIGEQARLQNTTRIDLEPLDDAAASSLVRVVLGEQDAADLLARTGGHALFLTESIRDHQLGIKTSGSIADLVTARIDRLEDNVKRLVEAGALIGAEFTFALAAEAADLKPEVALEAIDSAVEAELLHETASAARFRFSHQLVPEAIRQGLSRPARAKIHHRCATALADADGDEMEIAVHTLGAIPLVQTEVALSRGLDAAGRALRLKEFDRAIRLLEACLDVDMQARQRAEILIRLGDALVASGRTALGVPHFEEAAQYARRNSWTDILVSAALGHYGRSPYRKPTDRSTLELLREALEALGDAPSTDRARIIAKTAVFSAFQLPLRERGAMTAEAIEMAIDPSLDERLDLLESRAIVFTCPAGLVEREALDPELEELRAQTDVYFADAASPETIPLLRGDGARLRRAGSADEDRIRTQPIAEWRDIVLRSTFAAFDGDFDTARALCDEAGRIGDPYWGDSTYVLHALGHLFISSMSNEWEQTVEHLGILAGAPGASIFQSSLAWAQAEVGDHEGAVSTAAQMRTDNVNLLGEHIMGGNALIATAEVGLLLEDEALITLAESHLEPLADVVLGVPWACSLAAADPLARIARRRGNDEQAESYEDTARRLYTSLEAPALLARLT